MRQLRVSTCLVLCFLVFGTTSPLLAQEAAPPAEEAALEGDSAGGGGASPPPISADINDLRAPTAPAFTLLGVAPTSIDRPTTPQMLATSVLSALSQGNGLPKNYALEFAPYWFKDHPQLSFRDYYGATPFKMMLQNSAFSVVTQYRTEDEESGIAEGVALGVGFRTGFSYGDRSLIVEEVVTQFNNLAQAYLDCSRSNPADPARCQQQVEARGKESALAIQRKIKNRTGWLFELAGAGTWFFAAADDYNKGDFQKWGAWVTGGYRFPKPVIDLLVVVRHLRDESRPDVTVSWDVGGRFVWEVSRFALSAEALYRSNEGDHLIRRVDNRLDVSADIRVTDYIVVALTAGRDFRGAADEENPLLASLGLKFNTGKTVTLFQGPGK
jgi:hypothetical protein